MDAATEFKDRADAMNACRQLDSLLANPGWSRSVLADSIQLFPDEVLQDARSSLEQPSNAQQKDMLQKPQQDLADSGTMTQKSVARTLLDRTESTDPKKDLIQKSDNSRSEVQAVLDTLSAMSATLAATPQRIGTERSGRLSSMD